MDRLRQVLPPLALIFLAALIWFSYWKLATPGYLTFSDGARFADAARHLLEEGKLEISHTYFVPGYITDYSPGRSFPAGLLPGFPQFLALSFSLFGQSDFVVVATSGLFYVLTIPIIFLMGQRLFNSLTGILASLAFIFHPNVLDYATSGGSEAMLIFQITLAVFLILYRKRWVTAIAFGLVLWSMMTRAQAVISGLLIIGLWLFLLILEKRATGLKIFGAALVIFIGSVILLLQLLAPALETPKLLFYGSEVLPSSDYLRSSGQLPAWGEVASYSKIILSKSIYNLYNFFKRLSVFASPYIITLYLLSLLLWEKNSKKIGFRVFTILFLATLFLFASITIPHMRYVHPAFPFVAILAAEMLVFISNSLKLSRRVTPWLAAGFVVLFVAGPTLGEIFVDYRFRRNNFNLDKPPVYVRLAEVLGENTDSDDLTLTNLDAWAGWYVRRKTAWFPLKPADLVTYPEAVEKVDVIFLTTYKQDETDFFVGPEWRQVLESPEEFKDTFLAENFVLEKKFYLSPEENYERQEISGVILKKRIDEKKQP